MDQVEEMYGIENYMKDVREYGLETEVIYFALQAMKANSDLSISEAFMQGYGEWIK